MTATEQHAAPPTDPAAIVSVARAAVIAQVSRRAVYNWVTAGKVLYVRTAGGRLRIVADSLFRRAEEGAMP